MATYVINADVAPDGNYYVSNWSHAWTGSNSAREGNGTYVIGTNSVGFWHSSSQYQFYVWQAFFRFTTSIPSEETVTASSFRWVFIGSTSTNTTGPYRVRLDTSNWNYNLSNSNFVPGSQLTSLPLVHSSFTVPVNPSNYVADITIPPQHISSTVRLVTYRTLQESSSVPDDESLNSIHSFARPSFSNGPRLIVHTVKPSTLLGVHDAAVQLSDGSTVYLESNGVDTVELKRADLSGSVSVIDTVPTDPNETQALKVEPASLQSLALVCDGDDNLYVIGARGNHTSNAGRFAWENTGPGSWGSRSGVNTTNSGVTNPTGFSAVWVNDGPGRILTAFGSRDDGTTGFLLFDASLSGGLNVTASGTNPSWLVSSTAFRNPSGTGLSLTTDVFGGNRVGVFSWAHDALTSTSGSVTFQSRAARLTVGSSISSITSEALSFGANAQGARKGKVLGYGPNQFLVVWESGQFLVFKRIGTSGDPFYEISSTYFDVVYDDNAGLVWAYYWDPSDNTKLLRRAFDIQGQAFGDTVEVGSFPGTGQRDFIRTVKHLRNPQHVEVHWNRTA